MRKSADTGATATAPVPDEDGAPVPTVPAQAVSAAIVSGVAGMATTTLPLA